MGLAPAVFVLARSGLPALWLPEPFVSVEACSCNRSCLPRHRREHEPPRFACANALTEKAAQPHFLTQGPYRCSVKWGCCNSTSDSTYQEELLRSIRNPNPPRTEKVDPQHEVGIVQADFGHIDFRIADNFAVDLQSEKAMSMCAQLLAVGTAHRHCRVARQYRLPHAQRPCSSRREHGELRTGIEQGADPAAIELHRKVQAVARRSTRRDQSIR